MFNPQNPIHPAQETHSAFPKQFRQILILLLFCCLAPFAQAQSSSGTLSIDLSGTASNLTTVNIQDLNPENEIVWSSSVLVTENQVVIQASHPDGNLPAEQELAIVEIRDPDTQLSESYLIGTDGGSVLIIISDL